MICCRQLFLHYLASSVCHTNGWVGMTGYICIHRRCKHLQFNKGRQKGCSLWTSARLLESWTISNSEVILAELIIDNLTLNLTAPLFQYSSLQTVVSCLPLLNHKCLHALVVDTQATSHPQVFAQADTTFDDTFRYLLSLALLKNLLHWKLVPVVQQDQERPVQLLCLPHVQPQLQWLQKRKDVKHALTFHYFQLLDYAYSVKNKWTNAHSKELRLFTETKTQCMTGFVCILDVESQLEADLCEQLNFLVSRTCSVEILKAVFVKGKAIVPKTELLK